MSISYRLCPLSPKRLSMIEEDIDMVQDLDEASVPDLVDLGSEGFELDAILVFAAKKERALREAVFAHSGLALGEPGDGIRVHPPERVAEIHAALAKLPDDTIARHYDAARTALGARLPGGSASIRRFTQLFERLRDVYAAASAETKSMLTFLA